MIFIDLRAVLGTSRHRILLLHRRRHRCRVVCVFTHRRHLIELSRFERPFLRGVVFLSKRYLFHRSGNRRESFR